MENWAFDPEVLRQYAVHYRTGDVIPQAVIDKIRRSELFNQGFMTTEQTAAALSDMDIHSVREYEPFDPVAFERQALTKKRGLIPQIEPRYRYPYFSHIFDGGYSAGYYFYTWAEVLDKDAFEAFRERRPVRPAHRRRFPPQGARPRRRAGRHEPLPRLSRQGPRQAGDAAQPGPLDRPRSGGFAGRGGKSRAGFRHGSGSRRAGTCGCGDALSCGPLRQDASEGRRGADRRAAPPCGGRRGQACGRAAESPRTVRE